MSIIGIYPQDDPRNPSHKQNVMGRMRNLPFVTLYNIKYAAGTQLNVSGVLYRMPDPGKPFQVRDLHAKLLLSRFGWGGKIAPRLQNIAPAAETVPDGFKVVFGEDGLPFLAKLGADASPAERAEAVMRLPDTQEETDDILSSINFKE